MSKVHIVSSLLVAFGVSIFGIGCDPAQKPATVPANKVKTGPGSTTGGGTVVPAAPAGGTVEQPAEKPAEEKTEAKPEEKPAEEKPAEETKAEDK